MSIVELSLPPELDAYINSKVAEGQYESRAEVVREALFYLRERDRVREMRLQDLRREIQIGLDELDRGLGTPLDMDEIRNELKLRRPNPQA